MIAEQARPGPFYTGSEAMQTLQAGRHQVVTLEIDLEAVRQVVSEAGLTGKAEESPRHVLLDLAAPGRETPLLLFDAADPGNTGWFSRCTFYVDGKTGRVLQTPFRVANRLDGQGRVMGRALLVEIDKEMPPHVRLPGRQSVSEKVVYSVLYNFLSALQEGGVGLCGGPVVKPLAGRLDESRG
jgi:hypothetical protein